MNRYNILVIEDDKDIQELMVEFLKAKDYYVDAVSDGVKEIGRASCRERV